jgi:Flp pilus assembly protein TadG
MMRMPHFRRKRSQRGAIQVEFALSVTLTIFLMFWLFEMVMLVYTYTVISDAAKEGVRYAIVHGSNSGNPSTPGDPSAVTARVLDYARFSLHDISGITVTPNYADGDNEPQNLVTVTVSYPYVPYIKLPLVSPTITASAEGRIVY